MVMWLLTFAKGLVVGWTDFCKDFNFNFKAFLTKFKFSFDLLMQQQMKQKNLKHQKKSKNIKLRYWFLFNQISTTTKNLIFTIISKKLFKSLNLVQILIPKLAWPIKKSNYTTKLVYISPLTLMQRRNKIYVPKLCVVNALASWTREEVEIYCRSFLGKCIKQTRL